MEGLTSSRRDHLVDRSHHHVEEHDELGVVLGSDNETSNFRQTLQGHITEFRYFQELLGQYFSASANLKYQRREGETNPCDEMVDDRCFENVSEGNPVQESQHCFQSRFDQTWLIGLFQYLDT